MSTPATPTSGSAPGFTPLVSVVDFHHARGPEVEKWFGVPEGSDPAADYDWTLLPFMALSDGAHASTEDFSYFTLLRPAGPDAPATSLFGISCTRQMDASQLLVRPAEVTRSTVQKAVVVIADSPQYFGLLRESLGVVTQAWFAQREFGDTEILRRFQESLAEERERGALNKDEDRDQYLGMSLRELVREFRWQTLVLLKCCLLQPKMLFFGSRCERLCMMQFSLISLIPGLLRNLQDCAGPELNNYERKLTKPTSLRTSDRNSLLSYMGLPLQIFGKGSLFGPYTPLQQLDVLADFGTKSYIVGSTNSLLLQQRDRYSDILINLDDDSINITSASLRQALQLSVADRRWIDFITQEVNDTWDDANPGRPKTMGYVGSEEFIRLQFEEYLLSLISSVKYHDHLSKHGSNPRMVLPHIEGDPSHDFGPDWVDAWTRTENYRIWNANTESNLFDIVEPRHPCAGGLTIDDVQRRIAQQVQDLHLDERFAQGKEVLGRNLAAGKEKASTIFNKLYADMEALREAQRKRAEEARQQQQSNGGPGSAGGQEDRNATAAAAAGYSGAAGVDLTRAPQTAQSVGVRAGAYMNSWAAWAGEKRKAAGWGRSSSGASGGGNGGGGWGSGWGKSNKGRSSYYASVPDGGAGAGGNTEKELPRSPFSQQTASSPRYSTSSAAMMASPSLRRDDDDYDDADGGARRPLTQGSFGESLLDGVSGPDSPTTTSSQSHPASPRGRPLSAAAERRRSSAAEGAQNGALPAGVSEGGADEDSATAEGRAAVL